MNTITGNGYQLIHGDCVEVMAGMDAGSVDAIVTDPPYGSTQCRWDTIIPFDDMWAGIKHVRKPRAAVALFGSEPFSSLLRVSNLKEYKYDWIWEKNVGSGFLNAKIMPLLWTETISIFSRPGNTYNPQRRSGKGYNVKVSSTKSENYGKQVDVQSKNDGTQYYPKNILSYGNENGGGKFHPTQKPVALMEYLIKTYTNEGGTVLDFTFGSGSTGVAAMRTGRKFIGIEQDAEYFEIAQQRIANAAGDYVTTPAEKERGQIALWDIT